MSKYAHHYIFKRKTAPNKPYVVEITYDTSDGEEEKTRYNFRTLRQAIIFAKIVWLCERYIFPTLFPPMIRIVVAFTRLRLWWLRHFIRREER